MSIKAHLLRYPLDPSLRRTGSTPQSGSRGCLASGPFSTSCGEIILGLIATVVLGILATGCALAGNSRVDRAANRVEKKAPDQRVYFDVDAAASDEKKRQESNGSLWVDSYNSRLYENMYRASKIGDMVTIVVAENSQALDSGTTKTNRKLDHKASIDELGGLMSKLKGLFTALNPANLITAKTESKFQGDGSTERKGQLNAKMTATITRILQNGNMVLKGEQHIKVNKDDQILIVEGIIRPYDILPDNTVLSSSLADARITYSGFGVVAEKQSPGWLVRALDYIWPF